MNDRSEKRDGFKQRFMQNAQKMVKEHKKNLARVAKDEELGIRRAHGGVLERVLKELSMTQTDLAHRLGTTQTTISSWATKVSKPPIGFEHMLLGVLYAELGPEHEFTTMFYQTFLSPELPPWLEEREYKGQTFPE